MKKGLKINFTENGPVISSKEYVQDTKAMLQNIGINVATSKGSDRMFPRRGTQLLSSMLKYGYVSDNYAQHQANFAAIDTKIFFRATKYDETPEITSIVMQTSRGDNNRVSLGAKVTFGTGPTSENEFTL